MDIVMKRINIINDLIRACPFNENEPFVEVDDKTLDNIMMGKIVAKKGKLVDVSQEIAAKQRIQELIKLLESTDYKAIKFAEGLISADEYEEIKAQRQAWREEINRLESHS